MKSSVNRGIYTEDGGIVVLRDLWCTWRHDTEDRDLNLPRRENSKSRIRKYNLWLRAVLLCAVLRTARWWVCIYNKWTSWPTWSTEWQGTHSGKCVVHLEYTIFSSFWNLLKSYFDMHTLQRQHGIVVKFNYILKFPVDIQGPSRSILNKDEAYLHVPSLVFFISFYWTKRSKAVFFFLQLFVLWAQSWNLRQTHANNMKHLILKTFRHKNVAQRWFNACAGSSS
jgi:hypothetical protein